MRLIAPLPAAPVTLAQLRLHARIDHAHEDAALQIILDAAVAYVETAARRPLTPRRAIFTADAPFARWWFPVAPVRSLIGLRIARADGTPEAVSGATLGRAFDEPRLTMSGSWPTLAAGDVIEIEAEIGHDLDAPEGASLRQAVLLMAADGARQREATAEGETRPIPFGLNALIRQARYVRPAVMEPS